MGGKEFPVFPSLLKRRRSPQERREELQSRATIPRVPQKSQSIPGKPVFPALPLLSSRGSTHTTVVRGTALWESLVGNLRWKASRESHRSLDPREGQRYTAASAREENARAGPHSRRRLTPLGRLRSTPRPMSAPERNSQVPAMTPHKVLSQCDTAATAREESARAGYHSRRGLTPLGRLRSTPSSMSALERNSQVPALTTHKVLSQRDTAATAREECARAGHFSRRGLTPLGRHRSTPRSMSALERNPQIPAPTPHKDLGPDFDGRGIPRGPQATRMGTGLS